MHPYRILGPMTSGGVCLTRTGYLLRLGTWSGPELNEAVSVWGEMLAGQPQAGRPRVWHQWQTKPIGNVPCGTLCFFFFLAATGDVEEDGGLSDNVQTRKTIPTVCGDPPCRSWCLPLFLLWERWLALRWPQAPSAGSLRPELCPHCCSQGWGRISYQVWAWGLLDSMPQLRKQQGPWGLCPYAAVCSKRITVSSNPTWHRGSIREEVVAPVCYLLEALLWTGP